MKYCVIKGARAMKRCAIVLVGLALVHLASGWVIAAMPSGSVFHAAGTKHQCVYTAPNGRSAVVAICFNQAGKCGLGLLLAERAGEVNANGKRYCCYYAKNQGWHAKQ